MSMLAGAVARVLVLLLVGFAAMAAEQTDFSSRPDDIAPTLFGVIGELLYGAWGAQPLSSSG